MSSGCSASSRRASRCVSGVGHAARPVQGEPRPAALHPPDRSPPCALYSGRQRGRRPDNLLYLWPRTRSFFSEPHRRLRRRGRTPSSPRSPSSQRVVVGQPPQASLRRHRTAPGSTSTALGLLLQISSLALRRVPAQPHGPSSPLRIDDAAHHRRHRDRALLPCSRRRRLHQGDGVLDQGFDLHMHRGGVLLDARPQGSSPVR